ncbi:MAG: cbb3-type cytochrome c oxidase subunit I [Acidimicrobiales bacterium]
MASPSSRPAAPAEPPNVGTIDGLLGSADHKTIGRFWIAAGLIGLIGGLAVSSLVGFESIDLAGFTVVDDAGQFTQLFSLGEELVLFGGLVPLLIGIGTFLVPLQVGAPAIAFARGAAGAFWTWLAGTALMVVALAVNGGPGGGRRDFVILWALALVISLGAQVWALAVLATTILGARTSGMTLDRVPFTTWSYLVFSLLGLVTLPVIIADLVYAYIRVRYGLLPNDANTSLVGVVAPVALAPGVYWFGVPLLGMAADIIGVHTGRAVRAQRALLGALGALGFVSFAADYFAFGTVRPPQFDQALGVIAIVLAVLVILANLGLAGDSIRTGEPRFRAPLLAALVSGLVLLLAAATAVLGVFEPVALWLHRNTSIGINLDKLLIVNGTRFNDGIRAVVIGATVTAVVAGLANWAPKLWGRTLSAAVVVGAALLAAGGAVVWGAGAVLAGIDDQPALPYATLAGGDSVEFGNLLAFLGTLAVLAAAVVIGLEAARVASGSTRPAGGDPWTGLTLEWATDSPPSFGNFASAPVVRSATPLAEDGMVMAPEEEVPDEEAGELAGVSSGGSEESND